MKSEIFIEENQGSIILLLAPECCFKSKALKMGPECLFCHVQSKERSGNARKPFKQTTYVCALMSV